MSTRPVPPATAARPAGAILGGEAWIVPYEPGGPVWVSVGAPRIRVTDRRAASSRQPAGAVTR